MIYNNKDNRVCLFIDLTRLVIMTFLSPEKVHGIL